MNTKLDKILAEISAGELIDKITILEIKKVKISNKDKLIEIEKELVTLNKTKEKLIIDNSQILKLQTDLKNINLKLWDIEDGKRLAEKKNDFGEKQHVELSDFCDTIDKKGAFYMLSNSDTELTDKIYLQEGRFKENFLVSRTIASKAKNRNKAKEVVITNYKMES